MCVCSCALLLLLLVIVPLRLCMLLLPLVISCFQIPVMSGRVMSCHIVPCRVALVK
ncbi:hypothetical protein BDZ91DRAFT_714696 [Kalaharituber pfeilii]|nr:hypothetical protein BDZ91DRAFT_714696 [Kalaharituber pfeilii]